MKTPIWIKAIVELSFVSDKYANVKISCKNITITIWLDSKANAKELAKSISGSYDDGIFFLRKLKEEICKYTHHCPNGDVLDFCLEVLKDY